MFTLWMFGITLEKDWGTRRFLKYYFLCGIGAGFCDVLVNAMLGHVVRHQHHWRFRSHLRPAAGFRRAVSGIDHPVHFSVSHQGEVLRDDLRRHRLLSALGTQNSGVSNVAHLGGMIFGFLYLKMRFPKVDMDEVRRWYRNYKLQRAKKKFQVYMRKHGSDRGPWVN